VTIIGRFWVTAEEEKVLDDIINDQGRILNRASLSEGGREIIVIKDGIEKNFKRLTEADRTLRDGLSALKGKSKMKAYETKKEKGLKKE
jgi:hypothetical protein